MCSVVWTGRNSPRSYYEIMPTTLRCATHIHSEDTIEVGKLATPTIPNGQIEILISVDTASQDRDSVTICLEASVLTTALQNPLYIYI